MKQHFNPRMLPRLPQDDQVANCTYLIFVKVGIQQFLIAAVYDSWSVRRRKNIVGVIGSESVQADGLGTQGYNLALC